MSTFDNKDQEGNSEAVDQDGVTEAEYKLVSRAAKRSSGGQTMGGQRGPTPPIDGLPSSIPKNLVLFLIVK